MTMKQQKRKNLPYFKNIFQRSSFFFLRKLFYPIICPVNDIRFEAMSTTAALYKIVFNIVP